MWLIRSTTVNDSVHLNHPLANNLMVNAEARDEHGSGRRTKANRPPAMLITLLGIVTLVSPQRENATSPMFVRLFGIVTGQAAAVGKHTGRNQIRRVDGWRCLMPCGVCGLE
jgi:hypothetical protein